MNVTIESFFHKQSSTICYVVFDNRSLKAMVIDAALDFDITSGEVGYQFADSLVHYIDSHHLDVDWILETHAHADHLSAAQYLKQKLGAKVATGKYITQVQQHFTGVFNLTLPTDGSQFCHLFEDGEVFYLGDEVVTVMFTPGHTPDSVTYIVDNNAFVGDTLFMPDSGTARCDFPGGDASQLYHSIQRIFELGNDTHLYMCHDYQPNGRELSVVTSVEAQKQYNVHLKNGVSQHDYVALRTERDAGLAVPKLIHPSIQVNINAGHLPNQESNGISYLKIPLSFN
ncbi:MBL fold metallo-hydrolase [Pseudoalteromonas piratica]|uniref:Beta-lactamase n=1 Tax=Pseudoalteromonas piratica TaxID=1348114 RepID=A0A0A7EGY5_9GAMM|nr:MBL fold metallo-hydrolase [Pseudoalteromonas piratica]AIY65237.1 beta-lactamase [Pseudoalteromonas piratica]